MMAAMQPAASPTTALAAALRNARLQRGWTQQRLIHELTKVRALRNLTPTEPESIKRMLSSWETGHRHPGPQWRPLLAHALGLSEEHLFGTAIDRELPRPVLTEPTVTTDTVTLMLERRRIHAQTEHLFGPGEARALVDRDLIIIEQLVRVAPPTLRRDTRRAAALIAELGGWIAQDSGDLENARRLTHRAIDNARLADETSVNAMVLMRQSNIELRADPPLARDLVASSAELADGLPPQRLHASIGRQQALAAVVGGDTRAFEYYAAWAREVCETAPADDDLAAYANAAYVAADIAYGLLALRRADEAVDVLSLYVDCWPAGQRSDQIVGRLRLSRALTVLGDYPSALQQLRIVAADYLASPNDRARRELRLLRRILVDRIRTNPSSAVRELSRCAEHLLQGELTDG